MTFTCLIDTILKNIQPQSCGFVFYVSKQLANNQVEML